MAIDDDTVVGFASGAIHQHPDKPRPELWVNEVGVAPTHQGRGLAKQLMRAIFDVGRAANCFGAWVMTDRSNAAGMGLYSSLGGKEIPDDTVMFTFSFDV